MKAMLKYVPGVLTKKISMQDLRPLLNQEVSPYICGLSTKKVRQMAASFGPAAVQARKAGFDMVQIHGDRMCGSFASPVFNHRTDEYGGSIENRIHFAVEAVTAVRQLLPDMPIDFKLAVRQENPHYGNAGVLVEELAVVVPALERAGVTSFHVALANHSSLEDTHGQFHGVNDSCGRAWPLSLVPPLRTQWKGSRETTWVLLRLTASWVRIQNKRFGMPALSGPI